jgi:hypothetical protein
MPSCAALHAAPPQPDDQPSQTRPQARATPAPTSAGDEDRATLIAPPRERELRALSGVLTALADANSSAVTLAALALGRPFSARRFAVLVADARSTIAYIHAQELLEELEGGKGPPEARQAFEASLRGLIGCVPLRFEGRGGGAAFRETLTLVGRHRHSLEAVVFDQAKRPRDPREKRPSQTGSGS